MVVVWLAAILILIPLVLGLLSIKELPILTFICGVFLLLVASYLVVTPTVVVRSYYNSTSAVWEEKSEDIPFMPTTAFLLVILAILIMLAGSYEIWRY